jgi:hypothetical protein
MQLLIKSLLFASVLLSLAQTGQATPSGTHVQHFDKRGFFSSIKSKLPGSSKKSPENQDEVSSKKTILQQIETLKKQVKELHKKGVDVASPVFQEVVTNIAEMKNKILGRTGSYNVEKAAA